MKWCSNPEKITKIKKMLKIKNHIMLIEGSYILYTLNFKKKKIHIKSRTFTFERNSLLNFKSWFFFKSVFSNANQKFTTRRFRKNLLVYNCGFITMFNQNLRIRFKTVEKIFAEACTIKSLIKGAIYNSNFIMKTSLKVTGYFRRVWLVPRKKLLCLKIGKSFLNKIKIPSKLSISIVRRRLIKIYSTNRRLFIKFTKSIYSLRPADPYRFEGIQSELFKKKKKERFVNKKR